MLTFSMFEFLNLSFQQLKIDSNNYVSPMVTTKKIRREATQKKKREESKHTR